VKIVNRARLTYPEKPPVFLALFQVEPAVFRWIWEATGQPFDGVDYQDKATAIVQLRVAIEKEAVPGADLTILSVEPGPSDRAAARIVKGFVTNPLPEHTETLAGIIQEETAIDQLREAGETLEAYLITRGGQRDLALGGLMLNFLDALEKSGGVKYDAIRRALTEPPPQIIPARNMPGNKLVQ